MTEENQLTAKAEEAISEAEPLFKKIKVKTPNEVLGSGYKEQIETYRKKFPVGKKSTEQECIDKFTNFFIKNPKVDWELIQKATDLYLEGVSSDTYTMKAGNFISLQKDGAVKETLLEFCEEVKELGDNHISDFYKM